MNPTICIVNNSKTVADSGLKKKLRALQEQITRDFEPLWGWGANLKFNAKKFDMKVIIGTQSDSKWRRCERGLLVLRHSARRSA